MTPPYPSEITAFEPPLPLGISNDLPWGGGGGMDIFWNHTLLLWQFNHLCAIGRHISAVLCRCFKAICLLEFYPNMASITGFNFSSWNTLVIDGHDVEAVCKAFYEAKTTKGRPTAILAKTYKGKGVEGMVTGHIYALRGHVTSFLWKWKLYDFAFEKWLVGHILNKIIVIWFFKPVPFS